MADDLNLRILISAHNAASSVLSSLGADLGVMGGVALGAGVAIAAVGIALGVAVKKAADFQQAMLSNVAHAGLAKEQFDAVSQSVLNMAPIVGRVPVQLADALYPILSAFSGITNQSAKAAISLDTLRMSFETVAGTTVDGTAVARTAVGTFNALGLATNNVSENTRRMTGLFDIMDKTVQIGNMTWDNYKNVISKLAVSIQGTGVSFNEASAALAEMTNEGFSAQKAQTYLSNTFNTLAIKTDILAKHASKLGISFNEPAYTAMDLAQKIEYLNQITDGNKQKLLALMGNNSTALKTFNALSIGIGAYKSNLDALNHSQGALNSSFDTAKQGFNFQVQQAKAALDAFLITIGTKLLPVLSQAAAAVLPLISRLEQWITKNDVLGKAIAFFTTAFQTFGAIMSVVIPIFMKIIGVLGQLIGWVQRNKDVMEAFKYIAIALGVIMAASVIMTLIGIVVILAAVAAAIAVVVAVVMGIIWVFKHWGDIMHWFGNVFSAIGTFIHDKITDLKNFIGNIFNAIGSFIHNFFTWLYNHNTYVKAFVDMVIDHLNRAKKIWGEIFSAIGTFVHDRLVWIGARVTDFKNTIGNLFSQIGTAIHQKITDAWNWLVNFVKGWPTQAFQWGRNIIQGIISGIGSMFSALGSTVSGIASKIAGVLGFHSPPKEGPAHDADTWAPNLVKMYAAGLQAGTPTITRAASSVASGLQQGMTRSSGGSGGGGITIGPINIYGPSRQMADQFIDEISRRLRQKGALVTVTSGGRAT
jgi:TP901 family phage tail tape measure protein